MSYITDIWQEIDSEISLNPNLFRDEKNLEAKFYLSQKRLLLDSKDKDPKDQDADIQAPTIRSKWISLNRLQNTLKQKSIYFGLTNNEVEKLQGMISQCKPNFKNLLKEREQTIKDFKSNILLNSKEIRKSGDSQHLIECTKIFQQLKQNGESEFISTYRATDLQNYFMAVLALVNWTSNLMYITLYVDNATKNKTFGEAYLFKNKKYKASTIYGEKILLLSRDIYHQLQLYIKYI